MKQVEDTGAAQVVMPVAELHGRTVWNEAGDRLGVVRNVQQGDDGRIVSFDVRERWMLGPHHQVPAAGMRIDSGDVIVPVAPAPATEAATEDRRPTEQAQRPAQLPPNVSFAEAPVLVSGREGARARFGGLDIVGSLFGALVAIASLVLVGGVLGAVFGTDAAEIDTALASLDAVTTETMLVAAVTILLSCFLGGWAAGRSARFDGAANGVMTVVWVLAIGAALSAFGAWFGDQYDVFENSADLPWFVTDEFAVWGSVAFVATLVLMLVGGALGGALGESWHRRADRAMLDVVSVDDRAKAPAGIVGSPAAAQSVRDGDAAPVIRSDRDPR